MPISKAKAVVDVTRSFCVLQPSISVNISIVSSRYMTQSNQYFHALEIKKQEQASQIRKLCNSCSKPGFHRYLCTSIVHDNGKSQDHPTKFMSKNPLPSADQQLALYKDLINRGDPNGIQQTVDIISKEIGEETAYLYLAFAYFENKFRAKAQTIFSIPGIKYKGSDFSWFMNKLVVSGRLDELRDFVKICRSLSGCDREYMYALLIAQCHRQKKRGMLKDIWENMEEEGIGSSEEFRIRIEDVLISTEFNASSQVTDSEANKEENLEVKNEKNVLGINETLQTAIDREDIDKVLKESVYINQNYGFDKTATEAVISFISNLNDTNKQINIIQTLISDKIYGFLFENNMPALVFIISRFTRAQLENILMNVAFHGDSFKMLRKEQQVLYFNIQDKHSYLYASDDLEGFMNSIEHYDPSNDFVPGRATLLLAVERNSNNLDRLLQIAQRRIKVQPKFAFILLKAVIHADMPEEISHRLWAMLKEEGQLREADVSYIVRLNDAPQSIKEEARISFHNLDLKIQASDQEYSRYDKDKTRKIIENIEENANNGRSLPPVEERFNLLKVLLYQDDQIGIQRVVDATSKVFGEETANLELAFSLFETKRIAEVEKIFSTPGVKYKENCFSWYMKRLIKTGNLDVCRDFIKTCRTLLECDREYMYSLLITECHKINERDRLTDIWKDMEEEGIVSCEEPSITMADVLDSNRFKIASAGTKFDTKKYEKLQVGSKKSGLGMDEALQKAINKGDIYEVLKNYRKLFRNKKIDGMATEAILLFIKNLDDTDKQAKMIRTILNDKIYGLLFKDWEILKSIIVKFNRVQLQNVTKNISVHKFSIKHQKMFYYNIKERHCHQYAIEDLESFMKSMERNDPSSFYVPSKETILMVVERNPNNMERLLKIAENRIKSQTKFAFILLKIVIVSNQPEENSCRLWEMLSKGGLLRKDQLIDIKEFSKTPKNIREDATNLLKSSK